jgi:predicted DNA-binding protein (UPF0251 family)
MNKWCSHCTPGRGCGIHETRPDHCRSFFCLWMTDGRFGPEWKPEVSKFVLTIDPVSRYMLVQVDPGQPKTWRQEPYYSQLQRFAQAMLPHEQREALILVTAQGLSYEEAATIMGCAVGTIKSRVNRARNRLSELMQIDHPQEFGPDSASEAIVLGGSLASRGGV